MLIIAVLVLLTIFAFIGLAQIAPKAINSLGSAFSSMTSLFSSPNEKIILSLSNNSIKSGELVDVYFEHQNKKTAGVYEFKFDCGNKNLMMILDDGSDKTNLSCNTVAIVSSNNFKITPVLKEANSFLDSYIYVTFYDKENNSRKIFGKTVLTISNGKLSSNPTIKEDEPKPAEIISTSTVTTKPKNVIPVTQTNTGTFPNVVRKADLHIAAKSTGVVINNVFIAKTSFNSSDNPAVRFVISNIGNIPTGPWQFNAVLPTYPSQIFPSGTQPSLAPGEMIEYTLSLGNLAYSGNNVVTINVDTNQIVSELSETNNGAVMTLVNSGVGYNNATYPYNNYNNSSNPDLVIRIIDVGYIDNDGDFVEADSISDNKTAAIKFEIENIGDRDSGRFKYSVYFPSDDDSTVTKTVSSIDAGEKKRFIEEFEDPERGTNEFEIRVDTDDDVDERNENNNDEEESLRVY